MYLAILLISILFLYTIRSSGKSILEYSLVSAVVVLFPVTNMLILAFFQNFYGYEESMWLLPMFVIPPYGLTMVYGMIPAGNRKKWLVPIAFIVFFLCGWMSFDKDGADKFCLIEDVTEYDEEYAEVYDKILANAYPEGFGTKMKVVMAAPRELMEHARMYSGYIGLAYGRDIWEVNLDYAFYEPLTESAYDISKRLEEKMPLHNTTLVAELRDLGVNYMVLNKDNLEYGEDMQYPARFKDKESTYTRMDETRHYVIYRLNK